MLGHFTTSCVKGLMRMIGEKNKKNGRLIQNWYKYWEFSPLETTTRHKQKLNQSLYNAGCSDGQYKKPFEYTFFTIPYFLVFSPNMRKLGTEILKGLLRTLYNIYGGAFCKKQLTTKVSTQMFARVLSTALQNTI